MICPNVFDQVNQHTDFILVDDCDRYLNTGLFYDIITSDMTVNPKNNQSFTIPFEESAKLGFTTNYVPLVLAVSLGKQILTEIVPDRPRFPIVVIFRTLVVIVGEYQVQQTGFRRRIKINRNVIGCKSQLGRFFERYSKRL